MDNKERAALNVFATKARMLTVGSIAKAKAGHPGGSLSAIDILTYLYNKELTINPKSPKDPDRDRFVLSKGHACPALYAVLALKGYFPIEELDHLRQPDSILQGHPDMKSTPGIDMSTGSLGQGVSAACGMAKAALMDNKSWRVYAVLGDGEIQEGQVWEAMMFAAHYKLNNFCAIIDNNGYQIDGAICEIMSPLPIDEKLKAFGLNVILCDGHDFDSIEKAINAAKAYKEGPSAIVAKTVKGKGVSFMENQCDWHGKAPNDEQLAQALSELNATLKEWEDKYNG